MPWPGLRRAVAVFLALAAPLALHHAPAHEKPVGSAVANPVSSVDSSPVTSPALPLDPLFESIGDTNTITDRVVSAVAADRTGFLWIGTPVGLVRYDGNGLQTLQRSRSANLGPKSFVRALLPARDGRLWVGTEGDGLALFDPVSDAWQPMDRAQASLPGGAVRALAEDADGKIWVGTVGGGLAQLDPQTQQVRRFGKAQGLPDERVQSLALGRDGSLWVGTWNGLARLPRGASRLEAAGAAQGLGLAGRMVTLVVEDAGGRVWAGTAGGELVRSDGPDSVQHLTTPSGLNGSVQALVEMEGREVWIGRSNGIEVRRQADGALLRVLRHRVTRPWGLAGSDIRALSRDAAGVLWIGSYGGGLQRHVPNGGAIGVLRGNGVDGDPLEILDARSLLQRDNGEIWVGTSDHGIAVLGPDLRLRSHIRPGMGGYPGGRSGGLAQTRDGRVWAAAGEGVTEFDADARRVLRKLPLGKGRVRTLFAGQDGSLWAGTQDGLYHHRADETGFHRAVLEGDAPLSGDVNAIVQQSDGRLWVGTEHGLFTRDPGHLRLRAITQEGLVGGGVLGLLVDSHQTLWVDTTAGLHRLTAWNGSRASFEHLSARFGAGGHTFGANLLEDRNGRIWTHRGVYDPAGPHLHALSAADGVDIGTGWFRSYTALRSGQLLFGGSRGILVVDPARFRPWTFEPRVAATELHINGQPEPLARLTPRLVLRPGDRDFALAYASLDLSQSGSNRLRHRLLGVDAEWIQSEPGRNVASYGGLPPGLYTLEAQGSNRNGEWSRHPLRVDIEVQPAWWNTVWARLVAVPLLVGLLILLVRTRTQRLQAQQTLLEQRVQERTEALEALSKQLLAQSKALEESALTDPLTGLNNRRFAVERLDDDVKLVTRRFEEAARRREPLPLDADLCFFLIDLDHFKQVNDQHGHAAGDAVLVQMRERLDEVFRTSDYRVRWGGEEFLVVARGSSRDGAPELAERVRQAVVQRPFELPGGRTLVRSCSIGFACFPLVPAQPRAAGWATVLNLADAALYQAKHEGRNRWVGVQRCEGKSLEQLQAGFAEGDRLPAELPVLRGPDPEA